MAYMVIHLSGNNEESYPLERLGELLAELDGNEDEEAYVALTHESEWCLSANPFGLLMWENNFSDITELVHGECEQRVHYQSLVATSHW